MKRIALILALVLSGMAHAGTLGLHIGSQHFPAQQYNNFNPGAYYIHDNGATVGTYYNSERRQSVYAGWTWGLWPVAPASWGHHWVRAPRCAAHDRA